MMFPVSTKGSADALLELVGRQQTGRLDHTAFAMNPLGFDRIEPGAFDRQRTGKNSYAAPPVSDRTIVGPDPGPHFPTEMPRGIVPNQHEHVGALLAKLVGAPGQKFGRAR